MSQNVRDRVQRAYELHRRDQFYRRQQALFAQIERQRQFLKWILLVVLAVVLVFIAVWFARYEIFGFRA